MSIRILPMSQNDAEFKNKTIYQVQDFFTQDLVKTGKYYFLNSGINAKKGDLVLFQMFGKIIASAKYIDIERYKEPLEESKGCFIFDKSSIQIFKPITLEELREIDPTFKSFNQSKTQIELNKEQLQLLNERMAIEREKEERVIFCKIGWMKNYQGIMKDSISNGGAYNKDNIGHEIYNFKNYNGTYYGFVQSTSNVINLNRVVDYSSDNLEYLDNVLVVFVATYAKGPVIVGWYNNATVYRNIQQIPNDILSQRKDFNDYNIKSREAVLLPVEKRTKRIDGFGRSNIWFGSREVIDDVKQYILNYQDTDLGDIDEIAEIVTCEGYDVKGIAKIRKNQEKFRSQLLSRYKKCCLCGIDNNELLLASHIKPWSVSNEEEKTDFNNGLLLCAMHDRLFDKGFISFNDYGQIIISHELDEINQKFSNINPNMAINMLEGMKPFMKYHRENIFKDNY